MLLEEVFTHVLVVEDAMATEMETDWLLSKHFLHAFCSALSFRDVDLHLGSTDAFADFDIFLGKVELGEVLERLILFLKHDGRCE